MKMSFSKKLNAVLLAAYWSLGGLGIFQSSVVYAQPCPVCHQDKGDLKLCGRCKVKGYCSTECQRQDWQHHKTRCVEPQAKAESPVKAVTTETGREIKTPTSWARTLSTAPFRYPQMMADWETLEKGSVNRVLVMGAGLNDGVIPQVHEVQGMFPDARITILDNYRPMESALKTSDYSVMDERIRRMIRIPTNFASKGAAPALLKKWYPRVPKSLNLKNIELVSDDFVNIDTALGEGQSYDVIVATASLLYSLIDLSSGAEQTVVVRHLLSSLLRRLSEDGKLYCDTEAFIQLLGFLDIEYDAIHKNELLSEFSLDGVVFNSRELLSWSSTRTPGMQMPNFQLFYSDKAFVTTHHIVVISRKER